MQISSGNERSLTLYVASWQEYIESIVQFLADSSRLAMYGGPQDRYRFRRVIWQSYENMVHTFTNLIEVSVTNIHVRRVLVYIIH